MNQSYSRTSAPAHSRPDLLAAPVARALAALGEAEAGGIGVAEIDPEVADTAAFCERYGVSPAESANCVVIAGKQAGTDGFQASEVIVLPDGSAFNS